MQLGLRTDSQTHSRDAEGWQFTFIGADQDAIKEGAVVTVTNGIYDVDLADEEGYFRLRHIWALRVVS